MIFILADDLGYGDVHANNPESVIPTPGLDQLAKQGLRFVDAHSPSAVCTPTRYGILTGRYCWRTRLKKGVLWGVDPSLIETDRRTMADLFQQRGYRTACIGKWHLGMDIRDTQGNRLKHDRSYERAPDSVAIDYQQQIKRSPLEYGFDESFVILGSLNMYPYTYIEGDRFAAPATQHQPRTQHAITIVSGGPKAPDFEFDKVMDVLTERAANFIRKSTKQNKPFFLYFPLTAPHKPVLPTSTHRGKSGRGIYGDFVMQVDATVQAIDGVLRETNVYENTLVVFTSDNGSFMYRLDDQAQDHTDDFTVVGYRPENHKPNLNGRGTKADIYEAGHRVPLIARWPNNIPENSTFKPTTSLTDWYTTFAEILGIAVEHDEAEDSFSLLKVLTDPNVSWDRAPVIHHSSAGMFAIRDGNWKLIAGNGSGGRQAPKGKPFDRPYQLFDLADDPSETNDVRSSFPEVAKRLEATLSAIRDSGRSR